MSLLLLRRLLQMLAVLLLAALASYALLYLVPGGPVEQLRLQQQQSRGGQSARRMTAADMARLRARFDLDLYLPLRFSRWLIGLPRGPFSLGDHQFLAGLQVGCTAPALVRLRYADGREQVVEEGCAEPLMLGDLARRPASRGILFGDFGRSQVILRDQPVSTLIWSRLPYTLLLMSVSTALALLIAVPVGIYAAVRQYSVFDTLMTSVAFLGASLPSFVFAILAILVASIMAQRAGLPYLPSGDALANRDYAMPLLGSIRAGSLLDRLLHFVLPCSVLTFISIAGWSRFVRGSMLEVLRQDYMRTAQAKGLAPRAVYLRHGLRNALIPFITLLAGLLPALFGGAVIVETIFNWPGMGRLFVDALERSDYTVAMALTFIETVLLLLGFLLSDLLYGVVDPRISLVES